MSDGRWTFQLQAGEHWRAQHELNRHAQRHALAIIIARPPSHGGPINTASGCILNHSNRHYLLTANHVLSAFERQVSEDQSVRWQVSFPTGPDKHLIFDPRERNVCRDVTEDVAAIELTGDEVTRMGASVCSVPLGWPPPGLVPGDFIVLAGYPRMYREQQGRQISFPALAAVCEVTTTGTYHLVWQWERERIVNITGPEVPTPGSDLGGMSGGPVFLLRELVYPLVGVITDFSQAWDLLRVSHLRALACLPSEAA